MKMKSFLFVCAAALSCAALSCVSNPQIKQTGSFFTTVYGETVPAFADSSSDAELDVSLTLIDARDAALRDMVRSVLYGGQPPEAYAAKIIEDWKTTYTLTLEENSEWGVDQSWNYNEEHTVQITGRWAVVSQNIYMYQGGAHGNGETAYLTFDTQTPHLLTLNDIIPVENIPRLTAAIDRALRAFSRSEYGTLISEGAPLSSGIYFEDTFQTEDFYPARDGLHFQWDPYALAAYAFGVIDVAIDWKDLADILTPAGAELAAEYSR
jgi:hypothetical protein